MIRISLISIVLFAGCRVPESKPYSEPPLYATVSAIVPVEIRQRNYARGGSCAYASAITMFRYHGKDKAANWMRRNDYGAAYVVSSIARRCRQFKIGYRYEQKGNAEFLEWVSKTRRVAVLSHEKGHAVNFLGFGNGQAILLDNNRISLRYCIPKREFLRQWRGYAIALTELPPPPYAWR